jgi:MFS family permease
MQHHIHRLYRDPEIKKFFLIMLTFGIALGLYNGVLNNYLHDILNISRVERGIIELPREAPGLLLFLIVAVLHRFSEIKMISIALIISLLGMLGLMFTGFNRYPAILFIVIWSTGEHLMMPIRSSVALHMARSGKEGAAMGGVASARNIGQVAGFYLIPLLFFIFKKINPGASETSFLPYRWVFILGILVVITALLFSFRMKESNKYIKRQPLVFKRKFIKYYILEMFFGARKQVFLTFAPYVLIIKYEARTEYIALLYGIWSVANIFLAPLIGRLMDKIGYKKLIIIDTAILTTLCLLYGFAHKFLPFHTAYILVSVVFVIDAMLFIAGMARAMYAKSIADSKEEVTSTLSSGISINHLVSIVIAIAGGFLWEGLGMEVLFSSAAVFGAGSLIFATLLPKPAPAAPDRDG